MYYLKEAFFNEGLANCLWTLSQQAYENGSPWTREQFIEDINDPKSQYLLLSEKNQLIGFVGYHIILDEVEVMHVLVHKNYQKKGYAEKMLRDFLFDMKQRNFKQVFLEVRETNVPAKKLYEKLGFEHLYIRKNYYCRPKEDGLVMSLKIRK